jgi:predicted PurR-regulated permease PerM
MMAKEAQIQQQQPVGVTLTLESTGVLLGLLLSACALAGIIVKIITQFNNIANTIKEIEEDLLKHVASEGHEKLEPKLKKLEELDKKLDLHIQDMLNRKESVNMIANQLDQKINHKFTTLTHSLRDIESYLNKQGNYRIRQYHDETKED